MRNLPINIFLLLLAISSYSSAAETNYTAIKAIKTNGKASGSTFQLSVKGLASDSEITSADSTVVTLNISAEPEDVGKTAELFNVVLVNNKKWWMLNEDGVYVSWNASLKSLLPFKESVTLEKTFSTEFLRGNFNVTGELRYFFAYLVDGANYLVATPKAVKININKGDRKDNKSENMAFYRENIEDQIVQSRCIACHVDGGLARNSILNFARANDLSAENNYDVFRMFLASINDDVDFVLSNASGGNNHPGGAQVQKGDAVYKSLEIVLRSIVNGGATSSINFGDPQKSLTSSLNYFDGAELETKEKTLRRASIILAGRLPTQGEILRVENGSEESLREAILELMEEDKFHEFIVEGVEDRLLIRGANFALNTFFPHFPKLANAATNYAISTNSANDNEVMSKSSKSASKTVHELFSYVIRNDRPYSEILTADYMMLNRYLNDYLEGDAAFSDEESEDFYKPAEIKGYYNREQTEWEEGEYLANFRKVRIKEGEKPLNEYPHAGILSDWHFLKRYPTTPTNRNRARARWVLYHFLDIDLEKSAQRPTDAMALIDTNNPTMNNANCTVCHETLDPIAGTFQNWGVDNYYRGDNGEDALDNFYKYPPEGEERMYVDGDTWYRDMRSPGIFGSTISDSEYSLQELAYAIVKEEGFFTSAVKFWWPILLGEEPINRPTIATDQGFQARLDAYNAQQSLISELSEELKLTQNIKDVLVGIILSPFFRSEKKSNVSYDFNDKTFLGNLGNEQLLNTVQIRNKTESITGIVLGRWPKTPNDAFDKPWYFLSQFNSVLGGHDSAFVKKRSELTSPAFYKTMQLHAAELSCMAVAFDFYRNDSDRKLFSGIDLSDSHLSDRAKISKQIAKLHSIFLGKNVNEDDEIVVDLEAIFEKSYNKAKNNNTTNLNCNLMQDMVALGNLGIDVTDFLTMEKENIYYNFSIDWSTANSLMMNLGISRDETFTKKAWSDVIFYLMSDYKYIYE